MHGTLYLGIWSDCVPVLVHKQRNGFHVHRTLSRDVRQYTGLMSS